MKTSEYFLKAANTLVSYVVILSLFTAGLYAGYALWDNSLVFAAVDNVQADMLQLKPEIEEGRPSFDELLAINEDVVGWVTLDNTNIDYPILQGENNLTYFNKDIYGNFSLGGSIYLDTRNNSEFNDNYSLLYGHEIYKGRMFENLNLYKEEAFFNENQTGSLLTPDGTFNLKIYASLVIGASEDEIFNPTMWQSDMNGLKQYVENNALYINNAAIGEAIQSMDDVKILSFTTCTTGFTDARTVVLAVIEPSATD